MRRIAAGSAVCALCHEALRPDEDAVVTPDFLADDTDPFYPYSDAAMHRACFIVWDRRKTFIAHFNRIAERFAAEDGSRVQMTSEGDLVERHDGTPPPGPATH
ncbi:MAG TPA: hypothetical protein VI297_02430 [Gemmatimonadales bacterium]